MMNNSQPRKAVFNANSESMYIIKADENATKSNTNNMNGHAPTNPRNRQVYVLVPPVSAKRVKLNDVKLCTCVATAHGQRCPIPPNSSTYKNELKVQYIPKSSPNIGDMDSTLKELCEMFSRFKSPDFFFELNLLPTRVLALHGPPGCGKTLLARAISGQLKMPLIEVAATDLVGGICGQSEELIRKVFEHANALSPCVLFIDEINIIGGNRENASKNSSVSQLMSSLNSRKVTESGHSVIVIAASTLSGLDPGLRRAGRFDYDIAKERRELLRLYCGYLAVEPKLNFDKIAELTPGYIGVDLMALVYRAAKVALKRRPAVSDMNMTIITIDDDEPSEEPAAGDKSSEKKAEAEQKADGDKEDKENSIEKKENSKEKKEKVENEDGAEEPKEKPFKQEADSPKDEYYQCTLAELTNFLNNPPDYMSHPLFCLTLADFVEAIKLMQPSAKREGFDTVPDTTWDDIGALKDIREELKLAVMASVKHPELLKRLNLTSPSGVLLCGPPGCGKSLLAKAIANEADINFVLVKGPELMTKYAGESEQAVRACFQRGRNAAPCIIFFDDIDSLCPKRSVGSDGNDSGTRIVNQLLNEMDGVEGRKGVYIMAATNRPDIIDPAILLPGRLDTILHVGLPNAGERVDILKAITRTGKSPLLAEDVNLVEIAGLAEGYSGADLARLVNQAFMFSLGQYLNDGNIQLDDLCVRSHNFKEALQHLRPSVTEQDRKMYDKLRQKYAAPRVPTPNNNP